MKAQGIIFRSPNTPTLETLELPPLEPDEVLFRTHYSGISIGTERSIFSGTRTSNGTFPMITGYQAAGEIEQVGANVKNLATGDRVVAIGARLAGPVKSIWGAHLSHQVLSAAQCHIIPGAVKMEEAAMFILACVGLHAVEVIGIEPDDTVFIQGQGLIGQLFAQQVRNRGATIIAVETSPKRAALAKKYVTPHVLDPAAQDPTEVVHQITAGRGARTVVEATGNKKLIAAATQHLRPGGKMGFLAWYPDEISLDFHRFHANEIKAYFPHSFGDGGTIRRVLDGMADGSVILGDNITDIVPYAQGCEGFRRIIEGDSSIMGMVIDWRQA
jgi:2-desacetyl-2-hydroxyethyl bacteriochlorophyllide A dehydrogenase